MLISQNLLKEGCILKLKDGNSLLSLQSTACNLVPVKVSPQLFEDSTSTED